MAQPPRRAAPAFLRFILSPGNMVARSGLLRLSLSLAVWLVVAMAAVIVVRSVINAPPFAAGTGAAAHQTGRLAVNVGPAPSTAAAATVSGAALDADAPSSAADGSMSYTTEQVVERPQAPAPVAAAAPETSRRETPAPSSRRERGARPPTLATDHAAATAMQGLY